MLARHRSIWRASLDRNKAVPANFPTTLHRSDKVTAGWYGAREGVEGRARVPDAHPGSVASAKLAARGIAGQHQRPGLASLVAAFRPVPCHPSFLDASCLLLHRARLSRVSFLCPYAGNKHERTGARSEAVSDLGASFLGFIFSDRRNEKPPNPHISSTAHSCQKGKPGDNRCNLHELPAVSPVAPLALRAPPYRLYQCGPPEREQNKKEFFLCRHPSDLNRRRQSL